MIWTLLAATALSGGIPVSPDECCPVAVQAAAEPAPPFGEAGTTRIRVEGGHGPAYKPRGRRLTVGSVRLDRFVVDGFSAGVALSGVRFARPEESTAGAGVEVVFRWYAFRDRLLSPYADAGGGGMVTGRPVPVHGTRINFSSSLGVGVGFRLSETVRLSMGSRWNHISNGNLGTHNPGRDSLYGYMGASLPF